MEALPRGVLLLIVCVTTACGDMKPRAGSGGANPLAPTPVAGNAGFSARSVHLPRIVNRAGRSTRKALDATQAADLALEALTSLTDAAIGALDICPITSTVILCPVDTTDTCAIGGRIEVHGNWSGSIDSAGSGELLLDSSETLTDCQFASGVVVNGDPALTLNATIKTDGSGAFQFGGGIRWVDPDGSAGTCQVSVSFTVDATGEEAGTGTICGIDLNAL